jgi:hypothetical protein
MAMLGHADLRTWSTGSWARDLIPHLAFGMTTAAVYETLAASARAAAKACAACRVSAQGG